MVTCCQSQLAERSGIGLSFVSDGSLGSHAVMIKQSLYELQRDSRVSFRLNEKNWNLAFLIDYTP